MGSKTCRYHEKATEIHGGDTLPDKISDESDNLEDQGTQFEVQVPPSPSDSNKDKSVLKLDYVNPGLDTTGLHSPRDTGVVTRYMTVLPSSIQAIPAPNLIPNLVRPNAHRLAMKI